ncbi:MAG: carboxypeptidase regulatory-like domain-containing protein [Planctomycetes bacterium]|nr:carboxypeptidase regulatory-like domain-containing protein [Planctomycetota bacterium]
MRIATTRQWPQLLMPVCGAALIAAASGCRRDPAEAPAYVDARATRATLLGRLTDGRTAAGAVVGIAIEGQAGPAGNAGETAAFSEGRLRPAVLWTLSHRTVHVENRDSEWRNFHAVPFEFANIATLSPRELNLAVGSGAILKVERMETGIYSVRQDVTPSNDRAGVIVVLPCVPWLTRADAQGRFRFDDLPPGRGTLVVVTPDGRAAARGVELEAGTQTIPQMGLIDPR